MKKIINYLLEKRTLYKILTYNEGSDYNAIY